MGTEITFRRGSNFPTSGSGITLSEPVFETTLHTFHIGLGHGVTAEWVGAPISGLSADIAAGITYKTPTASAVKNYIAGLCFGNTGAATITEYVSSFNGLTGAVGGVCAAQANTFTALQSFTNGISLSGGLTVDQLKITGEMISTTDSTLSIQVFGSPSGFTPSSIDFNPYGTILVSSDNDSVASFGYDGILFNKVVNASSGITASDLNVTGNANISGNLTVSGGVTFTISENVLIEDNIIILNSNVTGSPSENAGIEIERGTSANVQLLWNESSDKWTFTNDGSTYYDLPTSVVTSFNGLTGAVGGVCAAQANTFTALNSFNAGISASGGTFSGFTRFTAGLFAAGITCPSIVSRGTALTLLGATSGGIASGSQIILPIDSALQLNGNGGEVSIGAYGLQTYVSSLKFNTSDDLNEIYGSFTLRPQSYINGDLTLYFPDANGTVAITSQLMGAVNGSTAATTAVTSFNGRTGAVQGVSAAVAGTGISVSGATGSVTITNIGVQSFNGNTGAVTGASLGANTFTALNSFNAGISSVGGTFSGDIVKFLSGLSASFVRVGSLESNGSNPVTLSDYRLRFTVVAFPSSFYTTLQADSTTSADRTITLPDASGTLALTSQLMGAVNGSTAATTAVTSFNGRTGAVQGVSAAVAGTGISVSGATGAVTITNTGVQSFNGLTGAVTGVTVGGANVFTALNSFNAGISAAGGTFSALTRFTAGISASGGMTLAGSLQGSTATFTGTVTGITFIGGLSGNATGIIINASSSSSELFPVLCTSTSSTVARADTVAPRVSIIPSTGQLTAPVFRVASTASGGAFTEITDAGIITANSDLKLICDGSILSLGDVNYITNGCNIVIDNSSGFIDVNAVGSPLTLTGSSVSVSGLLNAPDGISAAGGTFTALTRFTAGISAAGGVTLAGTLQGTTGSFSRLLTASAGISAAGGVILAGTLQGTTGSFSKLLSLSDGLSASGSAIFKGSVYAENSLYTDNILSIGTQINIANSGSGRVAIGDYDGVSNSTFVFVRDAISALNISNPYGDIIIGDPNSVDSGYFLAYNAAAGYLDGGSSSLTNFGTGSFSGLLTASAGTFSGLLTASAGISAASGVTFGGTVASDTGYRITSNAIKAQTGTTYTFLESDNGKVLTFNNGSAVTVTIPTALPVGFNCTAIQLGAGQVGFTAASGLTLQSYGNQYRLIGQHASATIIEYSANIVNLSGNLVV